MAKAVLLASESDAVSLIMEVKDRYRLDFLYIEAVETGEAEHAFRKAAEAGADIIIAYGLQTERAAKAANLPVIDISLTGQDVAMLADRAIAGLAGAPSAPQVALIVYDCMLSVSMQAGPALGAGVRIYRLDGYSGAMPAVEQALRDGCGVIIGGRAVCDCAEQLRLPSMRAFAGREGIENALLKAELLSRSIDLEKRNEAENTAYLNGIFHGVIEVNKNGEIRRINERAANLLGYRDRGVIGRPLLESFPHLGKSVLDAVLHEGQQVLSLIIKLKDRDVVTNIEPIALEKEIIGAVVTIQEGRKIHEIAEELRKELYAHGFVAAMRFEKLPAGGNPAYAGMIAKAKKASENSAPVLIFGEEGTELLAVAQCIHNAGSRSSCGFVEVDCNAWEPDYLDEMLFGVKRRIAGEYYDRSLIDKAEDGTLFLNGVEALSAELQYKICKLVRGTLHLNGENRQMPANVRVIAGAATDLRALKDDGRIGSDFFYTFSVQTLEIPPLRRRSEDIEGLADYFLGYYGGMYSKPVRLTKDALGFMKAYDWPGNIRQLDNFCHRLVLQTTRRSVDEAFVRSQLAEMEPCSRPEAPCPPQQAKDAEAQRLIEALKRNGGSRSLTAKELGISTTTLWRRMMKHGITRENCGG